MELNIRTDIGTTLAVAFYTCVVSVTLGVLEALTHVLLEYLK